MRPPRDAPAGPRVWSPGVPWPVVLAAGVMVLGLLAVSGAYGFHGDEMYYVVAGQHPAFGYVDQPPLTPLLSAGSVALLGVSPTAVRVLPALEMGLVVVLVATHRTRPRRLPPRAGARRGHGSRVGLSRRGSPGHDDRA